MGFFKKIFKGIGKVFKKIGRGIKKAFKKFGKFMGKIGVLGQVAMMFILPGVGQLLGKAWSAIAGQTATQATASAAGQAAASAAAEAGSSAAQATAQGVAKETATKAAIDAGTQVATKKATGLMAGGKLARGVGKVMQFTGKVVGTPGKVFSSITQGVTDTLGNFAKTASNNIFGTNFTTAAGDTLSGKFFSGGDSAFGRSFGKTSKFQNILTKAPTAQTLEAVDSYKSTLDALNNVPGADLIPTTSSKFNTPVGMEPRVSEVKPFDANDPYLTASTSAPTASQRNAVMAEQKALGIPGDQSARMQQQIMKRNAQDVIPRVGDAVSPPISEQSLLNTNIDPLKVSINDPTNPVMNMKNVGTAPNINAASVQPDGMLTRLANVPRTAYESLLNTPKSMLEKVETFAADPVGETGKYLFSGTQKAVQQGVNNQLLQGIGLVEKPVAPVYETTNTYVAPFEITTPQMFEAPETMSPMAFAQNVTNNPSPYGYTAFQYNQYMNRTAAA
tara:strand:- start:8153 stop:9664 length:1512 start_codon:yes stop_codon:yes gene_type:complete